MSDGIVRVEKEGRYGGIVDLKIEERPRYVYQATCPYCKRSHLYESDENLPIKEFKCKCGTTFIGRF